MLSFVSFIISLIESFVTAIVSRISRLAFKSSNQGAKKHEMIAVNYHFTRQCNYSCGFCFHTAKTSFKLKINEAKRLLKLVKEYGCMKVNFAGGEPFLESKMLGELAKFCKKDLRFESVSIISNASKITELWMKNYGKFVDILGISCDSMDECTNKRIGRGKGNHVGYVREAARLCREYNIKFKINTVVNEFNWEEDMSSLILELKPMRWKIFQVLPLDGENNGEGAIRQVQPFLIDDEKFSHFVKKHQEVISTDIMKVEDNSTMQSSYILIDEYGCFLDSSLGSKKQTSSILDVGVHAAMNELMSSAGGGFDKDAFEKRDGSYKCSTSSWSKDVIDIEDIEPSEKNSNKKKGYSIVLEGLDGIGKTTTAYALAKRLNGIFKKTPPPEIEHERKAYDHGGDEHLRRKFYMKGNYLVGKQVEALVNNEEVVVIDRYLCSTVAYKLGKSNENLPNIDDKVYQWPVDLYKPNVMICIKMNEASRLRRRQMRISADETAEERELRLNGEISKRINEVYSRMGCILLDITEEDSTDEIVVKIEAIIEKYKHANAMQ